MLPSLMRKFASSIKLMYVCIHHIIEYFIQTVGVNLSSVSHISYCSERSIGLPSAVSGISSFGAFRLLKMTRVVQELSFSYKIGM